MQGNQAQVIQLLASGSCYGSCTRLKSSLIEVIFCAGGYLTTDPWPPLWHFEKLKEVCIPLQHSLLGICFISSGSPRHPDVDVGQCSGQWDKEPPHCPVSPGCHLLPFHLLCIILSKGHTPWGKTLMVGDKRGLSPYAKTNRDLVKWFSSSHCWFSELK